MKNSWSIVVWWLNFNNLYRRSLIVREAKFNTEMVQRVVNSSFKETLRKHLTLEINFDPVYKNWKDRVFMFLLRTIFWKPEFNSII